MIPVIDVSQIDRSAEDRQAVVQQVRDACMSYGFFYVKGHGVAQATCDRMIELSRAFFALPHESKMALDARNGHPKSYRGYQAIGGEGYEKGRKYDIKEGFQIGRPLADTDPNVIAKRVMCGPNKWPQGIDGFKSTSEEYIETMRQLSLQLLGLIAEGMGADTAWLSEISTKEASAIRLLHYPPQDLHQVQSEGLLGVGAHTDFGALTVLLQDDGEGLEVLQAGQWRPVESKRGTFVVNIGDLMKKMTGGIYKSSMHRVINTTNRDRYSIPFFFDGNLDFIVRPLIGPNTLGELRSLETHLKERFDDAHSRKKVGV